VPHDQFDVATSLLFAAYHGGNVVGAALGQLLRDYAYAPYRDLFYVSWAFTSAGLLIFLLGRKAFSSGHSKAAGAPPRMAAGQSSVLEEARVALLQADTNEAEDGGAPSQREPPSAAGESISLAAELRAKGVREVLRQLRGLYATRVVLLWSLWWLFGQATHTLFGNYYQTLFGHFFEKVSYGWLEVALEAGAVAGSLAPWICKPHARRTWQLIALPSVMVTTMLVMSVILYRPQAWLYVWTVATSCVAAALKAWASSAIAEHLEGRRYALIFTVNTFLALGLATVASAVSSGIGASTLAYYWLSAALAACPALIATGGALMSRHWRQAEDVSSALE
jgi:thiamine transporter 2/3